MRRAAALLLSQAIARSSATGVVPQAAASHADQLLQAPCAAVAELHRRISGSAPSLALAYEPETLVAHIREASGTPASIRVRERGRTPAVLFSLPGDESKLLELDSRQVAQQLNRFGRVGMACRVYNVEVQDGEGKALEQHRALLRQVHINAVTDIVENVTLMHCPPERRVTVTVPVMIVGEDVCPGVRRGGHVNRVQRNVPVNCPGDAIPSHFVIDVSKLDLGAKVELTQLDLPPGVKVAVKDESHPVIKVAGKERRV